MDAVKFITICDVLNCQQQPSTNTYIFYMSISGLGNKRYTLVETALKSSPFLQS